MINSIDRADFINWVSDLSVKYKKSQIKAAIKVNGEMLNFYFELGKEINASRFKKVYGGKFFDNLSKELVALLPNVSGLSPINLRYIEKFYNLYGERSENFPQLVEQLFSVPWGHHRYIIDKCKDVDEALFYVRKTLENNWSRNTLLTFLSGNLYKREGKAITNFKTELPDGKGDLAQQITKDPYNFDFLSITENYNESQLKNALIDNIQKFLLELGSGFAFVGKETRLTVGETELYSDLLFYQIKLHAYVVVEVKTGKFKPEYLGQLGTYVSSVNHILKGENDNPTIGLLICKTKDNVLAKYSLENYNIPIGISEFELTEILPAEVKGALPTIQEIEQQLKSEDT